MLTVAAAIAVSSLIGGYGVPTGTVSAAVPVTNTSTVTRPTLAPCANLPQLPTARCGTVVVPQDRAHPRAGTTTVSYAVVPRTDQSRPTLGTIATNPGGPGGSTIDNAGSLYREALAPVLERRELLLMDTRGVGRSDPLDCAALTNPARVFGGLHRQRVAIGECGSQLGDRIALYGSSAIADDLDDVRHALGVEKLDLLGDSYGTFLMPVYAYRHPGHVRSIVLSGAYAVNLDSTGAISEKGLRHAIELVGSRTGAYSGDVVIDDLAALATRLRRTPTSIEVRYSDRTYRAPLDEWQLAGMVGGVYSSIPDEAAQLALAAAAAASRTGDLSQIEAMIRAHLIRLADTYALGSGLVSDAANWATSCHDYPKQFQLTDSLAKRRRDFNADVAAQNPRDFGIFSPRAWMTRLNYDSGACLRWPADRTARTPFEPGARLPDLPVLVLSGDLDANTPSAAARQAAAQFPNSTWVEVEGAGHTPTFSAEGQQLAMAFIEHPYRAKPATP